MYLITGANIHGQWLKEDPVLSGFQAIPSNVNHGVSYDIDHGKLINVTWSYNLFQVANKFFLSGSWHGNLKQVVEVPKPKEVSNVKETDLLLIGNDYNLFWFDINQHIMWVMSLEGQAHLKKVNLNTEMSGAEKKRLKKDDTLTKVCVSNLICVCLTACGTVYSGLLPSPLDTYMCRGKVCDIQCGYEHCLLLTDAGQVYSWGNGRRLQLGHGNLNNLETPTLVEALAGIHIIKISAGGWHSLALSEFGDVYAWGWNSTGQLGINYVIDKHPTNSNMHKNSVNSHGFPTLIDIIDENGDVVNTNVINISCGTQHSAILLEDYSIWTTGCNKYGQTGFASNNVMKLFSFKKSFQCSGKSSIYCGPWVTVIDNS